MTHAPDVVRTRATWLLDELERGGVQVTPDRLDRLAESTYSSDMPYVERNDVVAVALEIYVARHGKAPRGGVKQPKVASRESRTAPSRKMADPESVAAGNGKVRELSREETEDLVADFFRENPRATSIACWKHLLTLGKPPMAAGSFINAGGAARARKAAGIKFQRGFNGTSTPPRDENPSTPPPMSDNGSVVHADEVTTGALEVVHQDAAGFAPSVEVEKEDHPEVQVRYAGVAVLTVADLIVELEADLARIEATAQAIRTALAVARKYAA